MAEEIKLEDEYLYPEKISKVCEWTPESDMLLQITQKLEDINDTLTTLTNAVVDISKLFNQAAEAAAQYMESKNAPG